MPISFCNLPATRNRIDLKFASLKKESEKALIAYITAGDPNLETTRDLIFRLEEAGVDILELGIPFSDPTADGPVIQAASQRSLKKGTTLQKILKLVASVRKKSLIPIILFGYYNPIYAYGVSRFSADAKKAGIDAILVVDLPMEEADSFRAEMNKQTIHFISLIAPTTSKERIRKIAQKARGFLYYISIAGITGTTVPNFENVSEKIKLIRKETTLPIVLGFGISSPEQARNLSSVADGIVVGSAFVKRIEENQRNEDLNKKIYQFARDLKNAMGKIN